MRHRLVVIGSEPEVSRAIADLERPNVLRGFASNIVLTAPERRAGDTIACT